MRFLSFKRKKIRDADTFTSQTAKNSRNNLFPREKKQETSTT